MAFQESGKQRATRIQLDYYKKSTYLDRTKSTFALICLLGAVGWMALVYAQGEKGQAAFSRGQVTKFHASWNDNCTVCHVDFEPISKNSFTMKWQGHEAGKNLLGDARCESCHVAPVHHSNQKLESTPSCGGCHREHRGLDASIVRLPDSDCISCHTNMQGHLTAGTTPKYAPKITSFATASQGHPDFRLLAEKMTDPGTVKFNHKLHLTPGVSRDPKGKPWTYSDIPELERERFGYQKGMDLKTAIALDCKACHNLESADANPSPGTFANMPKSVHAERSKGGVYQPIVYDVHCKACHPLSFDDSNKNESVPHRYQPEEIRSYLEGFYSKQFVLETKEFSKPRELLPVPVPGRNPLTTVVESVKKQVDAKVSVAMNNLFLGKKTCGECHYEKGDTKSTNPGFTQIPKLIQTGLDPDSKAFQWFQDSRAGDPAKIVWPSIPSLWMPHAKFDHSAHRFMDCASCHGAANNSITKNDILLPGIDNCRSCHAPAKFVAGVAQAGVNHDCVECHNYHHGDQPFQGVGAAAWDPKILRTIEQMQKPIP